MVFKKGMTPWNKGTHIRFGGRPFQKGHKINLGKVGYWKGKNIPEEIKKRISEKLKGKHLSPRTEFKKGNKAALGHKLPKKCKETWFKKGQSSWNKGITGEKSHVWKNYLANFKEQLRGLTQYKEWRLKVFTRDRFTCQDCGITKKLLEAHHKKKLYDIFKEYNIKTIEEALSCQELWDVNNGKTLCKICHNKARRHSCQ